MKLIEIGGKTVEEVGFEKIESQLASLTELKIIILDSLCVKDIDRTPNSPENYLDSNSRPRRSLSWLRGMRVEQLDLSRNLLETWTDIVSLIDCLPRLTHLKLAYVVKLGA